MKKKKKNSITLLTDFLLIAAFIALDQITKAVAVDRLKGKFPIVLIQNVFELDYLENRGSAFGMFQGRKIFLLLMGVIFMAVLLYLLWKIPDTKRFLLGRLCILGIIAGGTGNMIDRILRGYVVDFFSFVLIDFPVFNVADIFITVSTALLAVLFLFVYREEELQFLSRKKPETQ